VLKIPKAVCVSACGNFGLASSSTGAIDMWNMQSGAHRKSFDIGSCPEGIHPRYRPPPGKQRSEERSVTGLATDSLNRVVIASTLDGTVNVRARALVVQGVLIIRFTSPISFSIFTQRD
jgi:U3 small nucleolar RNA-associated protein 21